MPMSAVQVINSCHKVAWKSGLEAISTVSVGFGKHFTAIT